ncbi:hypothetical protein E2C01_032211 [Portunus trituberculatus]|uniref:Uncharacterized protein n=1 Tax=Portunus trituberculatus TaxID=210409 RepID=A0A5B7F0C0_PORTR|nr:hypothetical protein [Portunus trituberculatus]
MKDCRVGRVAPGAIAAKGDITVTITGNNFLKMEKGAFKDPPKVEMPLAFCLIQLEKPEEAQDHRRTRLFSAGTGELGRRREWGPANSR